jgi:hypothetical protein
MPDQSVAMIAREPAAACETVIVSPGASPLETPMEWQLKVPGGPEVVGTVTYGLPFESEQLTVPAGAPTSNVITRMTVFPLA